MMKLQRNWGECSCSQSESHLAMILCLLPIALSLFVYMPLTSYFLANIFRDGLHALVAQYEQHMGNDAANSKAKGYNGINSQAPSVNPVTNISIPKLPLRTSGDKQ